MLVIRCCGRLKQHFHCGRRWHSNSKHWKDLKRSQSSLIADFGDITSVYCLNITLRMMRDFSFTKKITGHIIKRDWFIRSFFVSSALLHVCGCLLFELGMMKVVIPYDRRHKEVYNAFIMRTEPKTAVFRAKPTETYGKIFETVTTLIKIVVVFAYSFCKGNRRRLNKCVILMYYIENLLPDYSPPTFSANLRLYPFSLFV